MLCTCPSSNLPAAEVLAGAERMALVCLDDLDAVVGDAGWEQALFHFCNRTRESGTRLLFAASEAPRNLPVQLPDLQSRLSWGVVLQLGEPSDEDKLDILCFRAGRRVHNDNSCGRFPRSNLV